jgi:hypothetical protein
MVSNFYLITIVYELDNALLEIMHLHDIRTENGITTLMITFMAKNVVTGTPIP